MLSSKSVADILKEARPNLERNETAREWLETLIDNYEKVKSSEPTLIERIEGEIRAIREIDTTIAERDFFRKIIILTSKAIYPLYSESLMRRVIEEKKGVLKRGEILAEYLIRRSEEMMKEEMDAKTFLRLIEGKRKFDGWKVNWRDREWEVVIEKNKFPETTAYITPEDEIHICKAIPFNVEAAMTTVAVLEEELESMDSMTELIYGGLITHETLHSTRRSFVITPEGIPFKRMGFEEMEINRDNNSVEVILKSKDKEQVVKTVGEFFRLFDNPGLFQIAWNIAEDYRIERNNPPTESRYLKALRFYLASMPHRSENRTLESDLFNILIQKLAGENHGIEKVYIKGVGYELNDELWNKLKEIHRDEKYDEKVMREFFEWIKDLDPWEYVEDEYHDSADSLPLAIEIYEWLKKVKVQEDDRNQNRDIKPQKWGENQKTGSQNEYEDRCSEENDTSNNQETGPKSGSKKGDSKKEDSKSAGQQHESSDENQQSNKDKRKSGSKRTQRTTYKSSGYSGISGEYDTEYIKGNTTKYRGKIISGLKKVVRDKPVWTENPFGKINERKIHNVVLDGITGRPFKDKLFMRRKEYRPILVTVMVDFSDSMGGLDSNLGLALEALTTINQIAEANRDIVKAWGFASGDGLTLTEIELVKNIARFEMINGSTPEVPAFNEMVRYILAQAKGRVDRSLPYASEILQRNFKKLGGVLSVFISDYWVDVEGLKDAVHFVRENIGIKNVYFIGVPVENVKAARMIHGEGVLSLENLERDLLKLYDRIRRLGGYS